ncbi:long-chain-fatty-acid--CoA ligase [Pseudonocardia sp. ICBG601]|uniref:long-chain-fatty-acid--CoA ligase n=1 Tax=Pseudonocardia sp. ICBG601 TaxID=2846759 RepID=UPI001CF6EDCB
MTAADIVARHARTAPDAPALADPRTSRTWAQLDDRVSRLATVLADRGVDRGDRVAVLGLNSVELVESYLAVLRRGAICVPLNFRLTAGEVAFQLTDCTPVAVLCDDAFAATVESAREQAPSVRTVLTLGDGFDALLAGTGPGDWGDDVADDEPAYIMYTSGTTGRPKGAVLTHRNLMLHAFLSITHLGTAGDDRVSMSGAPLFHIAGLSGMLPTLIAGGRVIIPPSGGFDPVATVDTLERERVSSCFFVPAQWQAICAVPGIAQRDLSALRRITWGAAPASTTLIRTMIDTFPEAMVVTAFGQTECSPVTCALRGEDSVRKIGSVGTPMVGVEVRVVDAEMNDVPRGEVGEIVYRGPTVMREYWGRPEATAEAFRGGWFHSGDLVREDPDGFYYVVDRAKDMIISGGENVYSAEVEEVLAAHPGVADVAVVGVPDARWGETPLAVVVPADPAAPPDLDTLTAWCADRLARYKQPSRLALVEALPRNPSGKVLKTELRRVHGSV